LRLGRKVDNGSADVTSSGRSFHVRWQTTGKVQQLKLKFHYADFATKFATISADFYGPHPRLSSELPYGKVSMKVGVGIWSLGVSK